LESSDRLTGPLIEDRARVGLGREAEGVETILDVPDRRSLVTDAIEPHVPMLA
jgi:hypothetical protein